MAGERPRGGRSEIIRVGGSTPPLATLNKQKKYEKSKNILAILLSVIVFIIVNISHEQIYRIKFSVLCTKEFFKY